MKEFPENPKPQVQESPEEIQQKQSLQRALQALSGEHPRLDGALWTLSEESNDERVHKIAATLFPPILTDVIKIFRESDNLFVLGHEPGNIADMYALSLNPRIYGYIEGKWNEVARELVLTRAAYQEQQGKFAEKRMGSALYYRALGLTDRAQEAEKKIATSTESTMPVHLKDNPIFQAAVTGFLEKTADIPLTTEEEKRRIVENAKENIQLLMKDANKKDDNASTQSEEGS